jgi:DNA integrity scanning protein DisA with diadenylate cyclase activity
LARLQIESKVIHLDNNHQAWTIMDFLVRKLLDDNPNIRGVDRPKATLSDPVATFLSCIYINDSQRLGIKTAVMIREYLHLESLRDLLDVQFEDLVKVKGVGVKTAKKIMEVLE